MIFKTTTTAVIGAGISGLAAARVIDQAGGPVTIFEKSRGVGGRMATRRYTDHAFDHGAQYFTVRDPRFQAVVRTGIASGTIARWPTSAPIVAYEGGTIREVDPEVERYVGVPGMNAVCKQLALGLDVRTNTQIQNLQRGDSQWYLHDQQERRYGPFSRVIVAAPARQTADLIGSQSPVGAVAAAQLMAPCWAGLIRFAQPLTNRWSGAFLNDKQLSWAAQNHLKPQRSDACCLVVHADPDWSQQFLESSPEWIGESLLQRFWEVTGLPAQVPQSVIAHRWRYAIPNIPSGPQNTNHEFRSQGGSLNRKRQPNHSIVAIDNPADQWDRERGLGICGDWCRGGRVEGAFLSGWELAKQIVNDSNVRTDD